MRALEKELFEKLLAEAKVPRRLRQRLKVPADVAWDERELLGVHGDSEREGVLIAELDGRLFAAAYQMQKFRGDTQTGRTRAVVCDFCSTWLSGADAGVISFATSAERSRSFYCCYELGCSLHVRGLTTVAKLSRAQLREDLTAEQRIERLCKKLAFVLGEIGAQPFEEA